MGESFSEEATFELNTIELVGTSQAEKGGNTSQKKEIAHTYFRKVNDSVTKY